MVIRNIQERIEATTFSEPNPIIIVIQWLNIPKVSLMDWFVVGTFFTPCHFWPTGTLNDIILGPGGQCSQEGDAVRCKLPSLSAVWGKWASHCETEDLLFPCLGWDWVEDRENWDGETGPSQRLGKKWGRAEWSSPLTEPGTGQSIRRANQTDLEHKGIGVSDAGRKHSV